MASDKDAVFNTANSYVKKVSVAKDSCEAAVRSMIPPMCDISVNWRSDSGSAMDQSLEELKMELIRIHSRLSSLETIMKNQAWNIYNNWVDED